MELRPKPYLEGQIFVFQGISFGNAGTLILGFGFKALGVFCLRVQEIRPESSALTYQSLRCCMIPITSRVGCLLRTYKKVVYGSLKRYEGMSNFPELGLRV